MTNKYSHYLTRFQNLEKSPGKLIQVLVGLVLIVIVVLVDKKILTNEQIETTFDHFSE